MQLELLIIHCTATPEGREVSRHDIKRWHLKERGWKRLGYSDLIQLDGNLVGLTKFDTDDEVDYHEMTWGATGINRISRHVVYAGGMNKEFTKPMDTRTPEQLITMETYVRYTILRHPKIKVAGHNQFSRKACPSFNVSNWLRFIGIKEANIYDL